MDEVVQLARGARGSKCRDEALRIVKHWNGMFAKHTDKFPIFSDAFQFLTAKGATFPAGDVESTFFPETSGVVKYVMISSASFRTQYAFFRSDAAAAVVTQQDAMKKLKADLRVVLDKIKLC